MDIPIDDAALESIQHALKGSYDVDASGNHLLVGAEYDLHQLLDFWSGRDPGSDVLVNDVGGIPIYEATSPVIGLHDLIGALVKEIQSLRATNNKKEMN